MHYLLIDTSYLQYRSFYAYPTLTNSKNQPLGAIFGFIKSITTFQKNYQPDLIIFAKDLSGPTFRDEFYNEYKAGRQPTPPELKSQIEEINNLLDISKATVLSKAGYEADDMIAAATFKIIYQPNESNTLPHKLEYNTNPDDLLLNNSTNLTQHKVTIFTGDRDLYQLLAFPNVEMLISDRMGSTKLLSSDDFRQKYELDPAQWLDYKALVGDSSDNIKGVPGVGPKTATTLLKNHGSLSNIYKLLEIDFPQKLGQDIAYTNHQTPANSSAPIPEKLTLKLVENLNEVVLSYRLSKLAFPLVEISGQNWQLENAVDKLNQWEFKSIIKELNLPLRNENTDQDSIF